MQLIKTVDGIDYALVPISEKEQIEKSAHRIKEIVTYIHKIGKYSECAGKCIVIQKIRSMIGEL